MASRPIDRLIHLLLSARTIPLQGGTFSGWYTTNDLLAQISSAVSCGRSVPPPHPPSPGPIKPPTDENQSESYLYHLFMFWRKSDGWDGVKLTNGGRAIMRLVLTILKSTSISINIHNNDRQTFIGLTFSNRSLHRSIYLGW